MNDKQSQQPAKRKRTGGRYPKITPELIARVAIRRAQGISIKRAFSLECPGVPIDHWRTQLSKSAYLSAVYTQKETEAILPMIEEMKGAKAGQWQKLAWLLERTFAEDYSTRAGNVTVNSTVNTLVGVGEDVLRRASGFIKRTDKRPQIEAGEQPIHDGPAAITPGEADMPNPHEGYNTGIQ